MALLTMAILTMQVAATILDDPNDHTEVSLLYANQSEDDILVRDILDGCHSKYSHSKYSHPRWVP